MWALSARPGPAEIESRHAKTTTMAFAQAKGVRIVPPMFVSGYSGKRRVILARIILVAGTLASTLALDNRTRKFS